VGGKWAELLDLFLFVLPDEIYQQQKRTQTNGCGKLYSHFHNARGLQAVRQGRDFGCWWLQRQPANILKDEMFDIAVRK
jgi:hypothetical protein